MLDKEQVLSDDLNEAPSEAASINISDIEEPAQVQPIQAIGLGDIPSAPNIEGELDDGTLKQPPMLNLPPDVKPDGNGRFSCGGYTFNSLEQALSFGETPKQPWRLYAPI